MTIIDKIKLLFTEEQVSDVKFLDAKLVDGTIVRVEGEEFKVGDKLSVITESGEVLNAPEGMHELENGTVLVVDAEGMITEVRQPEVETEETPETELPTEEMAEELPTEEVVVDEAVIDEEDEIAKIKVKIEELQQAIMVIAEHIKSQGEMFVKVTIENEAVKAENEKLSKEPAVKPISTKKFEKVETVNTKSNRISDLLEKNKK